MTATSIAEATGLYGFAVAVLAANGSGMLKGRVLQLGQFFNDRPELAMVFLRRAEGVSQKEIGEELGMTPSYVSMMVRGPMTCMASLLDGSSRL
jgi:hypothetical protein